MNPRNQITLIGNVGSVPEVRGRTRDGEAIAAFSLAQSVRTKDPKSGTYIQKYPQWFQVSCFGGLAERVAGSLGKGALVLIMGELRSKTYEGKNGEKRLAFEINASEVLRVERLKATTKEAASHETPECAGAEAESTSADSFDSFESHGEAHEEGDMRGTHA